jgi:CheY-like chemotaxis protein/anti-sigma regulatory factor (Ser/Thr protein kinase)
MSHELRTPLASVLGFTRLAAAAGNLEEPTRTYVERVRDASQGLIALVNNILELSKLEAGGINLRPRSVDVSAVTRSSLEMFEPQAQEKGLRLRLIDDLPEGLRLRVDPDRLRQVLVNLIGNAVKFTVEGSVTVALGYDADKALLSMAVWDTGPGIALAAQERLFKRFSRVGDRAQGGTGLGLAICKGIVEGMGGEISATSRKGEGSRFAISAPAERANEIGADADPDVERLEILVGGGPAELPGLIQMLLQDRAEVVALADARAAIAMAKKRHFDLLILDATPRSGGVDALRKIRGGAGPSQHAPAIAVTAEPTSAARRLEGFASVIGQTVAAEELVSAIAHAMLMGRYDGSASDSEDEDHPVAAAVQ